jgi:hypothetical protein
MSNNGAKQKTIMLVSDTIGKFGLPEVERCIAQGITAFDRRNDLKGFTPKAVHFRDCHRGEFPDEIDGLPVRYDEIGRTRNAVYLIGERENGA